MVRKKRKKISADVWEIIEKSGPIGKEYAENALEYSARGDYDRADHYEKDLGRFLKECLRRFRISSAEYERAIDELDSVGMNVKCSA